MKATFLLVVALIGGLSACSTEASVDESSSSTAQVENDGDSTPSTTQAEPEVGGSIYYLEAEPGCYALTESFEADPLIDAVGKEVFPRDCSSSHSFEVFWAGAVPGFDGTTNLTQDDAGNVCVEEYARVFGEEPPYEIIPLESQYVTPYVYWFFPDDGLEASTYPGRLICGVFIANDDYTRMLSREGSLLPEGI